MLVEIKNTKIHEDIDGRLWVTANDAKMFYLRPLCEENAETVASNLRLKRFFLPKGFAKADELIGRAKLLGAKVERAGDGRYNFFTHPGNCAFAAALPQAVGDHANRKDAWLECALNLLARGMM